MKQIEKFYETLNKEETGVLATCSNGNVTMRIISPVLYDNKILFFTRKDTTKFNQLKDNPNCCISIGNYFAQAKAEFCDSTMLEKNKLLRNVYSNKFEDAFDEHTDFGGINSDFILLKPLKITGWETNPENQNLIPFSEEL